MSALNSSAPPPDLRWIQCHRCHAPLRDRQLKPHEFLCCGRCGEQIKSAHPGRTMMAAWAFAMAALITLIPANMNPILIFSVAGNYQENLIITGVEGLWMQGFQPLGALVFFSAILAPVFYLLSVSYVSACWSLQMRLPFMGAAFRLVEVLEPWNLLPVFAIACMVSVVKLRTLGTVSWEPGSLWILATAVLTMLAIQCFDRKCAELYVEGVK
jgi:paraquat-inducible protein A